MLQIAATTASMLNLSWAETGMMGARRAVVPTWMISSLFYFLADPDKRRKHTLDKLLDTLAVLHSFTFPDQIHFVLQNDNVFGVDTNDFEGSEMFTCLRLGTRFVTGDKEESTVHDGGTSKHGSHQNVVTGTVDEGDVSNQENVRIVGDAGKTTTGTHLCKSIRPSHPGLSHLG